ncbi:MAG: DUF1573 domain-containing protein [Sumerlaeia bacterium]
MKKRNNYLILLIIVFVPAVYIFITRTKWVREAEASLSLPRDLVQTGTLRPGQTKVLEVEFVNTSSRAIRVDKYEASCKCIAVELPDDTYAPNESGTIMVSVEAASVCGLSLQTVLLYADKFPEDPAKLQIELHTDVALRIHPQSIWVGDVLRHEPVELEFSIHAAAPDYLMDSPRFKGLRSEVISVSASGPYEDDKLGLWRNDIEFIYAPVAGEEGLFRDYVWLESDDKVGLAIKGNLVEPVTIQPASFFVPHAEQKQHRRKFEIVSALPDLQVGSIGLATQEPNLNIEVVETEPHGPAAFFLEWNIIISDSDKVRGYVRSEVEVEIRAPTGNYRCHVPLLAVVDS